MNLSDQVTSLSLSKKLKELGVKAESLYAYYGNAGQWNDVIVDMSMYSDVDDEFKECKLLPAYTVAELGNFFPDFYQLTWQKDGKGERLGTLKIIMTGKTIYDRKQQSEADFRGEMLAYILEHKLISL